MIELLIALVMALMPGSVAEVETPRFIEAEWAEAWVKHKHSPPPHIHLPIVFSPRPVSSPGVEQWRTLVTTHFPAESVETMLCIMWYESRGDPGAQNPTSSAAGLFQIMGFWWDKYGGDRYDPETNTALARIIYDKQGYGAWNPYRNAGLCHNL